MTDTTTETVTNPYQDGEGHAPREAWDSGRRTAEGADGQKEKSFYMSEYNQKCWQEGFDSVSDPAVEAFDATKVNTIDDPNIRLDYGVWSTKDDEGLATHHFGFFVTWQRNFNVSADDPSNIKPTWADNEVRDRVWRELDLPLVRAITYTNLSAHGKLGLHINLPCPPYTYELDGANLTIQSGPYRQSGNKTEWMSVLADMQAEVEDMPEGIDISDLYVRGTGTATVAWSVNIAVTELLDGDERLDGDLWMGDEEAISETACEVFEENAKDHIETDDLDLGYEGIEEVYVSEVYVD